MKNVLGKFVSAWLHPWASMQGVKEEGELASIGPSVMFVLVMGVLAGIITFVVGLIFPAPAMGGEVLPKNMMWLAAVIVPVISVIGSFLGAFIIWAIIFGLLQGNLSQYKVTYRMMAVLAAFSPISAIISSIPKVGQYLAIAINVWATIVMIRGIIIVMDTKPVRTWVTCGIVFGLLFLLGIMARVATQNEFANLGAGTGGIPDFGAAANEDMTTSDFGKDDEALNKQLEDLAAKEKAAPVTPKK